MLTFNEEDKDELLKEASDYYDRYNVVISDIPERRKMYQGQTPQSFRLKELERVLSSLSDDEKAILTDACKIFSIKNREVYMVSGEVFNIKITYPYDLKVAHTLLKGKDCND